MMHGDGVSCCLLGVDSPRHAKSEDNMLKYALLSIPSDRIANSKCDLRATIWYKGSALSQTLWLSALIKSCLRACFETWTKSEVLNKMMHFTAR